MAVSIIPSPLPNLFVGVSYSHTFEYDATSGFSLKRWSFPNQFDSSGNENPDFEFPNVFKDPAEGGFLSLESATGIISGNATELLAFPDADYGENAPDPLKRNASERSVSFTMRCEVENNEGAIVASEQTFSLIISRFNSTSIVKNFLRDTADFQNQIDYSIFENAWINASLEARQELSNLYDTEVVYVPPPDDQGNTPELVHKVVLNL
jgi:hypothetical protein